MSTTYHSKIGLEIAIPLFVVLAGVLSLMIYQKSWSGVLIILLVSAFIIHLFMNTFYEINGDTLKVKSGILYNSEIDIESIQSLKETHNPLSSPAASLDRIEIAYRQYGYVLVSPKDKEKFIRHLLSINPKIEIKRR